MQVRSGSTKHLYANTSFTDVAHSGNANFILQLFNHTSFKTVN